jgi:hypothetical protein
VPKGAISNLSENDVRETMGNCNFDGTPTVQSFILHKLKVRVVRIRHHDPLSFTKMRRHVRIGPIR